MSDAGLGQECLVHYNQQHIQVRKDFFDLCAYDKAHFNQRTNAKGHIIKDEPNQECMAKILRLVETLTDTARTEWYIKLLNAKKQGLKPPETPKNIQIELTYSAISALLYYTYGESTIRNSLAHLIHLGYITKAQETNNSIPTYTLNISVVQNALQKQAQDRLENEVLNSTATFKKRGRPKKQAKMGVENTDEAVENNTPRGFESNSQRPEFNTNNIYNKKDDNKRGKREDILAANQSEKPSSSSTSFPQEKIANFCQQFVAIGREMFDDSSFNVPRPKQGSEIALQITNLLKDEGETTFEVMRIVFLNFWNEREKDGSYWWRDPLKLTLKAYCTHYQARKASALFQMKQQQPPTPEQRSHLDRNKVYSNGLTFFRLENLGKKPVPVGEQ